MADALTEAAAMVAETDADFEEGNGGLSATPLDVSTQARESKPTDPSAQGPAKTAEQVHAEEVAAEVALNQPAEAGVVETAVAALEGEPIATGEMSLIDRIKLEASNMTSDDKRELGNILGLSVATGQEERPITTNEDARRIVALAGEAIHESGFEPAIPESIALKGEYHVQRYLQEWRKGRSYTPGKAEREGDMISAEKLADMSHM